MIKIKTIHRLKLPYQYKIRGVNWCLNRLTGSIENIIIRLNKVQGNIHPTSGNIKIIVSLTSYPARNDKVIWTIKSLLNQSVNVDRIILWLADEQYINRVIPERLAEYRKYGVEIRFCDDLKSHKKYFYVMRENTDAVIITVDDDVIYPEDTLEKLLKMHHKYPEAVVCNQARVMNFSGGELLSYRKWSVKVPKNMNKPSYFIVPIGEGGVLYPSNCFNNEVFELDKIKNFAWSADDIWLKFMAVINYRKSVVSTNVQRSPSEVYVRKKIDGALNKKNVSGGENDKVIMNLANEYKNFITIVLSEI